jgi:ATP-dependent helicase/nuclease subunit B
VKPVLLAGDVRAAAADEHARLRSVLSRVRADASLPAHGDDAACTHCEMRGLCRRDHWA